VLRALSALAAALVLSAADARTLEEVRASGKLLAASEGAFPPFNFFQGSKLTGFEVEVGDELARRLGVAAEWRALPFDALLAGLAQDRWDVVVASFAVTPERERAVTFAPPHYCSGGVVVAKDPAIRAVKDHAGRTVAVQTGTTYLEHVRRIPGVKAVKNFPRDTDARAALLAGRVDAWVTDRFVAKQSLDADPKAGLRLGDFVFVERIAPAVRKGNDELARALGRALADAMADGTYERISRRWLGEDVRCR
jgi:polar amino acid transport system substrate-binding protein